MRLRIWICALGFLAMTGPSPATAQDNSTERTGGTVGLRAGFSLDPDQFVLGGQVSLGKRLGIARLVPSVDVGFGSSLTTIAFNGDVLFRLQVEGSKFGLYGGAGPSLVYSDADLGGSGWILGLTLIVGAHIPMKALPPTNLEARFGVGDMPDFRGLIIFEF